MFDLTTRDIKYLSGVGPQRASVLNKELGIFSFHDLLYYFPYKYVDRSRIYRIRGIDGAMPYIQLKGEILGFETAGEGRQRRLIAHFSDGTGIVDLIWFQGIKYLIGKYKVHQEYIVFGKPTVFNGRINIAHPDIDPASELKLSAMGLQPYYNTTEKMKRSSLNSHAIEKMMKSLVGQLNEPLPETLSPALLAEHHLMPLTDALMNIHFPSGPDVLRKAEYRLKFEELFYVQLNILRYAKDRQRKYRGYVFEKVGDIFNGFYSRNLPFELTNAQKRVLKEIRRDLGAGRQMNRLLQGDVGSGKTLVALMSMLIALDNGYQACMMAPTEILANQHYETIRELLYGMDVRVELLTGSIKGKRREAILSGLLTGDVQILIGTHAVIEDTVNFASLGLVVIDEQHRFGVAQRARLWTKSVQPPHILVMTATPIPRTLAMTLYGDLDVSVIDELPPGRKPITTIHQFDSHRVSLYRSVRKQIDEGRQVYIVYPLIKESEKIDLKNLEEGYLHICEEFPDCRVCKVHGKIRNRVRIKRGAGKRNPLESHATFFDLVKFFKFFVRDNRKYKPCVMPACAVARDKGVVKVDIKPFGVVVNEVYRPENLLHGDGQSHTRKQTVRKTHNDETAFCKRFAIRRVQILVAVHPATAVNIDYYGQFFVFRAIWTIHVHKVPFTTVAEIIKVFYRGHARGFREFCRAFLVAF